MNSQLEDYIIKLHNLNFADTKQITENLEKVLLDKHLKSSDIDHHLSLIFNHKEYNLFIFLDQNSLDKDRVNTAVRKKIFEIISKFIEKSKNHIFDELEFIKESCLKLFQKDISDTVKAAALGPIIRILKCFDPIVIKNVFKPEKLVEKFLEYVKKTQESVATVKGKIWYLLSLVCYQYPNETEGFRQDVGYNLFMNLSLQFNKAKPEQATIAGALKGFRYYLHHKSTLTAKQTDELYIYAKVGMKIIQENSSYKIVKACLKLFSSHTAVFCKNLLSDYRELLDQIVDLVKHKNRSVKENASDLMESFMRQISHSLNEQDPKHKIIFENLMQRLKEIITEANNEVFLLSVSIRAVGIFSRAIKKFLGEQILKTIFARLSELSERSTIRSFEEEEKHVDTEATGDSSYSSLKVVLYRQKQLTSFVNSFSYFVENIQTLSEKEAQHLFTVFLLCFKHHVNYLENYRTYLYDAMVNMIMALTYHSNIYNFFMKRIVSQGLFESLRIPDAVIFAAEDYQTSIKHASTLWIQLLNRTKVWTEAPRKVFFMIFLDHLSELLQSLDLSYVIKIQTDSQASNSDSVQFFKILDGVEYLPSNTNDQQYFYRLVMMLDEFLPKLPRNWIEVWLPSFVMNIIKYLRLYPRCLSLLRCLRTLCGVIENLKYLENIKHDKEKSLLFNLLKEFFRDLYELQKEYQDELLIDSIKLLLNTPTEIVRSDESLFFRQIMVPILVKALISGLQNLSIGMTAIDCLANLLLKIKKKLFLNYMCFIAPLLSDYLVAESKYEMDSALRFTLSVKEINYKGEQLTNKILDFLGSIGGYAHHLVPSEHQMLSTDRNLALSLENTQVSKNISWDYEAKVIFPLPLLDRKIDLNLAKILPNIISLVQSGNNQRVKTHAAELLHGITIFMIGKSAQRSNVRNRETNLKKNFSALYSAIFPVIFQLGSDSNNPNVKLFNTFALQITRWFSNTYEYEAPDLCALLDSLMACIISKENSSLREFAASCIGEFIKWTIKQRTKEELKKNYGNIKSIVKRVQSYSSHPDVFNRYGALLALREIVKEMREEKFLVDLFILDLVHVSLNIARLGHGTNSKEMSQELTRLIQRLEKVIEKNFQILMTINTDRGIFTCLDDLLNWLFENFLSNEQLFCELSMDMLHFLLTYLIEKKLGSYTSYIDFFGKKSNKLSESDLFFKNMRTLSFEDTVSRQPEVYIKNCDFFNGQIFLFKKLFEKKYFTPAGIIKLPEFKSFIANMSNFFREMESSLNSGFIDNIISEIKKNFSEESMGTTKVKQKKFETFMICFEYLGELKIPVMEIILMHLRDSTAFPLKKFFLFFLKIIMQPFDFFNKSVLDFDDAKFKSISKCFLRSTKKILFGSGKLTISKESDFYQNIFNNFIKDVTEQSINLSGREVAQYFFKSKTITSRELTVFCTGLCIVLSEFADDFANKFVQDVIESSIQNITPEGVSQKNFSENELENFSFREKRRILLNMCFDLREGFGCVIDFVISVIKHQGEVFHQFETEIFNYLVQSWAVSGKQIMKELVSGVESLRLIIPITRLMMKSSPDSLRIVVKDLAATMLQKHKGNLDINEEELQIHIKLANIFLLNPSVTSVEGEQKEIVLFFFYLERLISSALDMKYSFIVHSEVLSLIGLALKVKKDKRASSFETYSNLGEFHFKKFEEHLNKIQLKYFPTNTQDLLSNTKEEIAFKTVLGGFINMIKLSEQLKMIEILFPIMREQRTRYEKKIEELVDFTLNFCFKSSRELEQHEILMWAFNHFLDKSLDDRIKNNMRCAIIQRLLIPMIRSAKENALVEFFCDIGKTLEELLENCLEPFGDSNKIALGVIVKTSVLKIYGELYRKVAPSVLRSVVHKRIYGDQSQGNELTKKLIDHCNKLKQKPLSCHDQLIKEEVLLEAKARRILLELYCESYNCLISVIMSTQTKEGLFVNYLLNSQRDKNLRLWENLIEIKQESDYNFQVKTNFNIRSSARSNAFFNSEKNISKTVNLKEHILRKYFTESLMSQADDQYRSSFLKEEIFGNQLTKHNSNEIESDRKSIIGIEEEEVVEIGREGLNEKKKEEKQYELDEINENPIMPSLMEVIEFLDEKFPGTEMASMASSVPSQKISILKMPLWMNAIHQEMIFPECLFAVKVFLIKLIVNLPDIFGKYANNWVEPLVKYIAEDKRGGKGFHYFLRDICLTLLEWMNKGLVNNAIFENIERKKLLCKAINNLIKIAADKEGKDIFRNNLLVVQNFIEKWKDYIYIDQNTIQKMIKFPATEADGYLWRLTGMAVVDFCLNYRVLLSENFQDMVTSGGFDQVSGGFLVSKNFLTSLLENLHHAKKKICYVASSVVGKILSQFIHKGLEELETNLLNEIQTVFQKDAPRFCHMINAIIANYPSLFRKKIIFQRACSLITTCIKKERAAVFIALDTFINKTPNRLVIEGDIKEVCLCIQSSIDKVLRDGDEDNQRAALLLIETLAKNMPLIPIKIMFEIIYPRLSVLFSKHPKEEFATKFYIISTLLYESMSDVPIIFSHLKQVLLSGISSKFFAIRERIFQFLDNEDKTPTKPMLRLLSLMNDIYQPENEDMWLPTAIPLLLALARRSSDYERELFDDPLDNLVKFYDFDFKNEKYFRFVNRSQPLTPVYSLALASSQPQGMTQEENLIAGSQLQFFGVRATIKPQYSQSQISASLDNDNFITNNKKSQQNQYPNQKLNNNLLPPGAASQLFSSTSNSPVYRNSQTSVGSLFMGNSQSTSGITGDGGEEMMLAGIENEKFKPLSGVDDFLAPKARRKINQDISQFLEKNYMSFAQGSLLASNTLRYTDNSKAAGKKLTKQADIRSKQQQLFIRRQQEARRQEVNAMRKYRIGELPDIEIKFRDILDPLTSLAFQNSDLSGELFILIFENLFREERASDIKQEAKNMLIKLLGKSKKFDYGFITAVHKTLLALSKLGQKFDTSLVAKSGMQAKAYHTAALVIEETILNRAFGLSTIEEQPDEDIEILTSSRKTRKIMNENKKDSNKGKSSKWINEQQGLPSFKENGSLWVDLLEVYTQLKSFDEVQGIMSYILGEVYESYEAKYALDQKLSGHTAKAVEGLSNLLGKESPFEKTEVKIEADASVTHASVTQNFIEYLQELDNGENMEIKARIVKYLSDERKECLASLAEWGMLKKDLGMEYKEDIKVLENITKTDAKLLVLSYLSENDANNWKELSKLIEFWERTDNGLNIMRDEFPIEYALVNVTGRDLSRAKIYLALFEENFLKKWQRLTAFSNSSKHELVSSLQSAHELKEFLKVASTPILDIDVTKNILDDWSFRSANPSFDGITTWYQILCNRELYSFYLSKVKDLSEEFVENKKISWQIQTASGMIKMARLDTGDVLMDTANKGRPTGLFDWNFTKTTAKLRMLQTHADTTNLDLLEVSSKHLYKVSGILEKKMEKLPLGSNNLIGLKLKSYALKCRESLFNFVAPLLENSHLKSPHITTRVIENIGLVYSNYKELLNNPILAAQGSSSEEENSFRKKQYKRYAIFCERLLRMLERMEVSFRQEVAKRLSIISESVAKNFIIFTVKSFKAGLTDSSLVLKLLDTVQNFPNDVGALFQEATKSDLPFWTFIKWLPQMMHLFNSAKLYPYFKNIFAQIADIYPEAIVYHLRVSQSEIESTNKDLEELQQKIRAQIPNHDKLIQHLNLLTHPEHRLDYYIKKLMEIANEKKNDLASLRRSAKLWLQALVNDVLASGAPSLEGFGKYNLGFIKKFKKLIYDFFGEKLANVDKQNVAELRQSCESLTKKITEYPINQGYEPLDQFSVYLAEFSGQDRFEIPGQYSGRVQPFPQGHITITSFDRTVLTLGSLRRPKRLTMFGSDEKSYRFLVKGVEDVRLDQRIEQLFSIMNEIFESIPECMKNEIKISTYQIIPMTQTLGILEWVDSTAPLREILEKEMVDIEGEGANLKSKNRGYEERMKWFEARVGTKSSSLDNKELIKRHITLLSMDRRQVVENFLLQQAEIPRELLKRSLERLCISSEAYLKMKNKFIRNYGTLVIANYILGIGDRHLENFLIRTTNGDVIGIDFGISFGGGLNLLIPELMPFRLTRVIETIMLPVGVHGIFRHSMILTLNALKSKKNVVLDCCSVFIRDPLLEWVKASGKTAAVFASASAEGEDGSLMLETGIDSSNFNSFGMESNQPSIKCNWLPRKKIEIVRMKLLGFDSVNIMIEELKESRHSERDYKSKLFQIVLGTDTSRSEIIEKQKEKKSLILTPGDQVDCLIDHARDPNILGRTWIGWNSFV